MALTEEEKTFVKQAKDAGLDRSQIIARIGNNRTAQPQDQNTNRLQETFGDVKEIGSDIKYDFKNTTSDIGKGIASGQSPLSTGLQYAGGVGRMIGSVFGNTAKGGAKALLSQEQEDRASDAFENVSRRVADTDLVKRFSENMAEFDAEYPEASRNVRAGLGIAEGAATVLGAGPAARLTSQGIESVSGGVARGASSAKNTARTSLPGSESMRGAAQTASDLVERVPRAAGRVRERMSESSERAKRISESTPAVREAIKSDLDERVINTVAAADAPTLQGYKEIIDLAEKTGDQLGVKERPEIVAGRAAEKQFEVVNNERKRIGQELGNAVDELSKTTQVDMSDGVRTMNEILRRQGIEFERGEAGTALNFTKTNLTDTQRSKVRELYRLATESGEQMTPAQIHRKDQMFSQLQRESRFDGIGDLFVDTNDGPVSLFRVFRDVYSEKLDEVSPSNIRELNRKYRDMVMLTNDIEKSIIKSGKFESSKSTDPAEFAQTNLRRVLSDAQSAADYRSILRKMDSLSRDLGYDGADPEDLITFGTEMRKFYDSAVPQTSFQGQDRLIPGIGDVIQKISEVGTPNVSDQQRALRRLIDDSLQSADTD